MRGKVDIIYLIKTNLKEKINSKYKRHNIL